MIINELFKSRNLNTKKKYYSIDYIKTCLCKDNS